MARPVTKWNTDPRTAIANKAGGPKEARSRNEGPTSQICEVRAHGRAGSGVSPPTRAALVPQPPPGVRSVPRSLSAKSQLRSQWSFGILRRHVRGMPVFRLGLGHANLDV